MNRSMIAAAALVAGIAIAAPMLAWSADAPPQATPAAPAQPGMPGMGGMQGMMGGMRDHMGEMGRRGWMREMMMHRMMQLSPQQRCDERLARRAGMAAYVVAKLNLTAEQRPLWEKLQGVMQANADKQRQLCATLKPIAERAPGDGARPHVPARAVPHRPGPGDTAGPTGGAGALPGADP